MVTTTGENRGCSEVVEVRIGKLEYFCTKYFKQYKQITRIFYIFNKYDNVFREFESRSGEMDVLDTTLCDKLGQ